MSGSRSLRPRPRALVRIDPENAYARLGVSPLASTEEIKAIIDEQRAAASARRHARADERFGAEEAEMARLQMIEREIGSPRTRALYDQRHPWNDLLTVQPASADRALSAGRLTTLVSAWIVEVLGHEAMVPSAASLALWAPSGLAPALTAHLQKFMTVPEEVAESGNAFRDAARHPEAPLSLNDLDSGHARREGNQEDPTHG